MTAWAISKPRALMRSMISTQTAARASGPVIHRLVPSAAASRPSRVAAYFHVTRGRPRVVAIRQSRPS